jgi:hypothetical protein
MELTTAVKGFVKQAPEQQNLFEKRERKLNIEPLSGLHSDDEVLLALLTFIRLRWR